MIAAIKKTKNALNHVGSSAKNPASYLPTLLLLVAALFFLPGILKKAYNKWKLKRDTAKLNAGSVVIGGPVYTNTNGGYTQAPETINLMIIARAIHDSIYSNDWFGASEDEDEMIAQLKRVPKNLIPRLAIEYAKISTKGRTLQEEYIKYISSSDLKKAGVWDLINQ